MLRIPKAAWKFEDFLDSDPLNHWEHKNFPQMKGPSPRQWNIALPPASGSCHSCSVKKPEANFPFQIRQGYGNARLGNIQINRGLRNAWTTSNLDKILELFKSHKTLEKEHWLWNTEQSTRRRSVDSFATQVTGSAEAGPAPALATEAVFPQPKSSSHSSFCCAMHSPPLSSALPLSARQPPPATPPLQSKDNEVFHNRV